MADKRKRGFPLGRIVATPAALAALQNSSESCLDFLARHASGDWGCCDETDREANNRAIWNGDRIFSVYYTRAGVKIWVITEADRSNTCILLPEDY